MKTKPDPDNPPASLQECGLQASGDSHKSLGPENIAGRNKGKSMYKTAKNVQ